MDHLKNLSKKLTKDGKYYIETVDNIAELYMSADTTPALLIELEDNIFYLNFRCDMLSQVVAQITYDITMIDADIAIGPDFYATEELGIIYGEQAVAVYFAGISQAVQAAMQQQESDMEDVTFIVTEPMQTHGSRNANKMQRMWGPDLE